MLTLETEKERMETKKTSDPLVKFINNLPTYIIFS